MASPFVSVVTVAACGGALVALAGGSVGHARAPRPPAPPTGAELERLSQPPVRTSIASQRIYFVMPDRYANGDPSNDRGGLTGARAVTGYDPADPGWYHGGDLRGLTGDCTDPRSGLARVKDLGFTTIWITPPVRQKFVQGSSAGYHGYWGLDFTAIDPHLGTEADFAAFVDCAHRLGLKVFLDVVVNHTADVIRLSNPRYVAPEQAPYRDCRGRRFQPSRYVGRRTFPCLSAGRMPRVPTVPAEERDAKRPEWLNDPTRYHNRGDIDFGSCSETCFEQGDFFGLDDLFTEQPAVVDGLAELWGGWISRYRLDGFRIDTARHVNRGFFGLWVPRIRTAARTAGVPDLELFGEVFVNEALELSTYVRNRGLPNVLDFPLQDAVTRFAGGAAGPAGIANRLRDDDYFAGSLGIAHTPPTFLGNHDMGRAALEIREHAGADARLLERVLLGHSLLYLLRGAPVVLYGDELGLIGRGGDQQARHDLFPTQVREWREQERIGAPPIGDRSFFDEPEHPVAAHLRTLGALRDAHPALSTGPSAVRRSQGNVLVVSRFDWAARQEYVAAFNAGASEASISVPTSTPAATWTALLGPQAARAASRPDGTLSLALPPLSAVLLRADSPVPARAPSRPALTVARDNLSNLWRLAASAGPPPAVVAFAIKRGSRPWTRVSVDDSPPYRAFVDPARLRRGERVSAVAVSRSPDGRTAVSRAAAFVPRPR